MSAPFNTYGPETSYPIVAREGWIIVLLFFIVASALTAASIWWLGPWGAVTAVPALAVCLWCLWFFRDPVRRVPTDQSAIICPADGVVCLLGPGHPPRELGLDSTLPWTKICVFMNVFNVHVNRSPIAGRVLNVQHSQGKFLNAAFDKASDENERCSLVLQRHDGLTIACVQIAGLIARRIICRAKVGDALGAGERFGLIRFGSRVDVYLPGTHVPLVKVADRVVAGQTVIARFASTSNAHQQPNTGGG